MGYPKHYVGRYPQLANWLKTRGHAVYPMEMCCTPRWVKGHFLYGNVDVVSMKDGKLIAWEYKSENDSVKRGLKQCENYARFFDLVNIVLERLPNSKKYEAFKALGVGIYGAVPNGYAELLAPEQQTVDAEKHDKLVARFKRNVYPEQERKRKRDIERKLKIERVKRENRSLETFI